MSRNPEIVSSNRAHCGVTLNYAILCFVLCFLSCGTSYVSVFQLSYSTQEQGH